MANNKLDQLRPVLKPCQLYQGQRNLVVEDPQTHVQIVLPKQHLQMLQLLDGTHSIKDISSKLYGEQGQVSFHSILTTLKLLKEAGLLTQMEHDFQEIQEEKAPHEQRASILSRPLLELPLLGKVTLGEGRDWIFFTTVAALLSALFLNYDAYTHVSLPRFLKSSTGYDSALLRIFLMSSLLMSMKALMQGLLLLASVGSFYRLHLRVLPYGIALGINDNSLYAHSKKRVIITYGVISALLYLVSYALLEAIPAIRPYRHDLAVLSLFLTLIELNPYRRSDFTKLFYFFYAENQLKNIMPYLKNCSLSGLWKDTGAKLSDEIRYVTYSVLSLAWAIGFTLFSFEIIIKTFPGLFYQIHLGSPVSSYSAMAVMALLVFITGHLTLDLLHTVLKNILAPVLLPLMKLRRVAKVYQQQDFSADELRQRLKQNLVFNQLNHEALDFLLKHAEIRSLKPGGHLILQGDNGRDVYFLLKGEVDVHVRTPTGAVKHIVKLGSNTVIGEMAILEATKRKASVTALEDIVFMVFPESVFTQLLEQHQNEFEKIKNRIQLSQFVASANLFKDFPPEVMNIFVEAGNLVLFPGGHNVVDEGERDKTFYLLIKGKVDVIKSGQKVAELVQGDFFGEVALIANVPRTATVHAVEDSLFLYIEDKDFWQILSDNIELAMYIESVGRHRMGEAA
jgi:CRP-like cAMP-binding protein